MNFLRCWVIGLYPSLKRALDWSVSLCALILLAPALAVISILIVLIDGHPVFFRQERIGLAEAPFYLYKFRTMAVTRAETPADETKRITRLGGFLRKTSLDELPGLWNVFLGEMSFVGPRPLLPEYLGLYSAKHRRRHDTRPGLTGLAQVTGRNGLSWKKRLDRDIEYVNRRGLCLDVQILIRTVPVILNRKGVLAPDGKLMAQLTSSYLDE